MEGLEASFFARPTVTVAEELLGKVIVHDDPAAGARAARIVEVEAYLGLADAASHARRGPTPRSAIMFGPAGRLYVYLVYGMHHCMNVVTEADGTAGAVLIRAAEPVRGFGPSTSAGAERQGRGNGRLSGPGKLCAGLGITRQHNGLDLTRGPIVIADAAALDDVLDGLGDGAGVGDGQSRAPGRRGERMKRSARIGVEYAGAWARRRLRFYLAGNAHVSGQPRD